LCIIQDDYCDWKVESSLMAEIYSNATLTIAATGSRDGHGGCFFDRWSYQMTPPRPVSVKIVTMNTQSNGLSHVIHARPILSAHAAFLTEPDILPRTPALMRRAWAFQERLLSLRIIHFHHEELVWECNTSLACECGWKGENWKWNSNKPFKISCAEVLRDMGTRSSPRPFMTTIDRWTQIVSRYSELALTFDADRLPALSGLASRLASKNGLWLFSRAMEKGSRTVIGLGTSNFKGRVNY
jgi:hypothetical protein